MVLASGKERTRCHICPTCSPHLGDQILAGSRACIKVQIGLRYNKSGCHKPPVLDGRLEAYYSLPIHGAFRKYHTHRPSPHSNE